MTFRYIGRPFSISLLVASAITLGSCTQTSPTFYIPLDLPPDVGSSGSTPVSSSWTVLSCTKSSMCPVTIQIMASTTANPRDCKFASVPMLIDISSSSPRIEWTLQSASADKLYAFGWRGLFGVEQREGVRIRDSDMHDEDDHDPLLPGPLLAPPFAPFHRTSNNAGYTDLITANLQKPSAHRVFYYRIHVDQTDADGGNLVHCKFHGPMIINRG